MNKVSFCFLLFFTAGIINAQENDPIAYTDSIETGHYKNMYRADSVLLKNPVTENNVYPKKFRDNLPSRYKGNEFDYTTIKPRLSFWDKLLAKIARLLQSIFGETVFTRSGNITGIIIRLFAIVLVGLLLYFIIKYLIGKDGGFFFGKKNRKVNIKDEELHENIHEINFPESILQFEKSGDFRSAIRYQFLFLLKKLSDKKLIVWNPEKTNKDYVLELKAVHVKEEFSRLSYIFDYIWYGEFSIDEKHYLKFKNQFQSFKP